MYDLTEIAMLMISLVFAIVAYLVAPWIRAKLTSEQLAYVRGAVQIAVYAAEKLYGSGNGAAKFAHAEKVLAEQYNVKLDTKKLASLIDAEIKKMENGTNGGVTIVEHINGVAELEEDLGGEEEEEETQAWEDPEPEV